MTAPLARPGSTDPRPGRRSTAAGGASTGRVPAARPVGHAPAGRPGNAAGHRPAPALSRSGRPGSLRKHFRQTVSSRRSTLGLNRRGDTGSSRSTCCTVSHLLSALKGGRPVSSSYRTRPGHRYRPPGPPRRSLAGLLRSHVTWRADHRPGGCSLGVVQLLGQAEVGDLRSQEREIHVIVATWSSRLPLTAASRSPASARRMFPGFRSR